MTPFFFSFLIPFFNMVDTWQVEMDTKGWKLHFGKSAEAP
jgi:hypothetical protein